jgi:hypothetical protein
MDMAVFLGAAAALLIVGVVLLLSRAADRRPPLRLPREHLLEERGDELYDAFGPRPASPVDRSAPALEVHSDRPVPETRAGPRPAPPARRGPLVIDHDPDEHAGGPR